MHDDPRYPRFFAYLSLFCFSMLGLVASSNVFMIFIFWELVGVCSYLLIGFWYEEKVELRRGEQGVHRQPDRRRRHAGGPGPALDQPGHVQLPGDQPGAARSRRRAQPRSQRPSGQRRRRAFDPHAEAGRARATGRPVQIPYWTADAGRAGDLRRLRGQERPVPAPRLAARRDGRADAGLGPDPRGDDGGGGRLPGRPVLPAVHAPTCCSTSPTPAGSRCSSRRRSRWSRPTTRRSWPTRRSASSGS